MFYVANKSRESETGAYYNLYAFICHSIFQSATNNMISSNILQYNNYVTGFAKTVPIGTTIEIHFMA